MLGDLGVQAGDALVGVDGNHFSDGAEFVRMVRLLPNFELLVVRMPLCPVDPIYRQVRLLLFVSGRGRLRSVD